MTKDKLEEIGYVLQILQPHLQGSVKAQQVQEALLDELAEKYCKSDTDKKTRTATDYLQRETRAGRTSIAPEEK